MLVFSAVASSNNEIIPEKVAEVTEAAVSSTTAAVAAPAETRKAVRTDTVKETEAPAIDEPAEDAEDTEYTEYVEDSAEEEYVLLDAPEEEPEEESDEN